MGWRIDDHYHEGKDRRDEMNNENATSEMRRICMTWFGLSDMVENVDKGRIPGIYPETR